MLAGFDDAVVVITGGASGIGRGIALEAARRGARVAIADVNDERLASTLEELTALGADAIAVHCDVTSDDRGRRPARSGRSTATDTSTCCATTPGVAVLGPAELVEMDDWEWILQVNVLGIVRGVRAFVPAMLERGSGHVLNTASVAGIWAYTWDATPYITSKFAAYGMSEALARRLHPPASACRCCAPGWSPPTSVTRPGSRACPRARRAQWLYFPPEMLDPVEPEAVGPMVADAVLAGRFTIFTHANDAEIYKDWRLDIDASLARVVEGRRLRR